MSKIFSSKLLSIIISVFILIGAIFSIAPTTSLAAGVTYYVDSIGGIDSNNGTSSTTAWKTLTKVNGITFQPGDTILFRAGSTWTGTLYPKGSGTSGSPIKINMYGTGNKPIINGAHLDTTNYATVYLYNQEYWEISNLEITNDNDFLTDYEVNNTAQLFCGVRVQARDFGTVDHIYLLNLNVHDCDGYYSDATKTTGAIMFTITGTTTVTKFNDLKVEGCTIKNTDRSGIRIVDSSWATSTANYGTNFVVRNNYFEHIKGDCIVMRVVGSGGIIEYNTANHCVDKSTLFNVPFWNYMAKNVVMQYNEVYDTQPGLDSQGYDLDEYTDNSIVQYNYSHNNAGGFILLMGLATNGTVRYNISANEKFGKDAGTSNSNNINVYNNTFYNAGKDVFDVTSFKNNIVFYDSATALTCNAGSHDYNAYYTLSSTKPSEANAVYANPLFVDGTMLGTGRSTCAGVKLQASSPLINKGISISGNGGKDFWGNTLYSGAPDIGAHEYQGSTTTPTPLPGITYNPSEDSYVRDGTYAATNFGTTADLSVKNDALSYARQSLLTFNFGTFSGSNASSAKLRLYVASAGSDANRTLSFMTVNENWSQGTVTWNTSPAFITTIGDKVVSNATGVWIEQDVTSVVNSNMSDKIISFKIKNQTGSAASNGSISFNSKEASANKPQLVIR